ncbi:hypothetical protein PanWU01x14_130790 [Parasponia andersonii]|uniref:Transmembrane protein n=1 Tax=Parasponia andersonii TaxID=3476 RepID=A0A2P5CQV3_PARAD|nr:hypothetical protein PanWU01x14_130790 [Parasponia andersonii]
MTVGTAAAATTLLFFGLLDTRSSGGDQYRLLLLLSEAEEADQDECQEESAAQGDADCYNCGVVASAWRRSHDLGRRRDAVYGRRRRSEIRRGWRIAVKRRRLCLR